MSPLKESSEESSKEGILVTDNDSYKPLLGIYKIVQSATVARLTYFINNSRKFCVSLDKACALEVFKGLLEYYDRILHFESDYTYRNGKEVFDQKSWEIKIINAFCELEKSLNDNVITEIVGRLCSARKNESSFRNVRNLCEELSFKYKKELEELKKRFKEEQNHQSEGTTVSPQTEGTTMSPLLLGYRMEKNY